MRRRAPSRSHHQARHRRELLHRRRTRAAPRRLISPLRCSPALAHGLERIAQARTRAELDALKAQHQLEVQRLQYQHERQLAARIAAERAAAEEEARTNSM